MSPPRYFFHVHDPVLRLLRLVKEIGKGKWSVIARRLKGRTGKQCRERWLNHIQPGLVRKPWTEEEEMLLVEGHRKYGNKWAKISRTIVGKTENMVKNHMYVFNFISALNGKTNFAF